MSPVRIEARGEISFKLPDGEITKLSERETLTIPDVPGTVTIEVEDPAFTISKEMFPNPNVRRKVDAIRIRWILPQEGEKQGLQKLYYCSAGDLKENPVTVLNEEGKEIVRISWEEEQNPSSFFSLIVPRQPIGVKL